MHMKTEADNDDLTIHCATCSQPVTLKKAMVHFEKCFSRVRCSYNVASNFVKPLKSDSESEVMYILCIA